MARLVVHQERIPDNQELIKICPFGALEEQDGSVVVNAACKMCRLCVKKGPAGAVEYVEDGKKPEINKGEWKGIAVYADHVDGVIHPVTFELIGKAKEMAAVTGQEVSVLLMGKDIREKSEEILHYGADKVFVYDKDELERFKIEPYTAVFEDFIRRNKPSSILVGATTVGRQLAPRVAARMKTGLTADCTILEMNENSDLSQIRPAFGGNIMAHIKTPNHRPQIATVRYKIMNAPARSDSVSGEIVTCDISNGALTSHVEVLDILPKEKESFIENSDVLIVAGRGVKKEEDLHMLNELADLLGGQVACTRPMAESGWLDAKYQIGLSGRTVRPKLIITCGVSGAIQFVAGMNHSDTIFAINNDPKAPIFKAAHYCLVGDLYEILPKLIARVKEKEGM